MLQLCDFEVGKLLLFFAQPFRNNANVLVFARITLVPCLGSIVDILSPANNVMSRSTSDAAGLFRP